MKNLKVKLSGVFVAMMVVFGAQFANAQVQAPIWDCTLSFDVDGGGLKVFAGHFQMTGEGYISCNDIHGNYEDIPVFVTLGSQKPLSLNISAGKLRLMGLAKGVGVATQPSDLLGDYLVAGITGSLFFGGGINLAAHNSVNSTTLNLSLQLASGFGFSLGVDYLSIYPM